MIARMELTSREIQTAVLVAFRSREVVVSFKMVFKYRHKEISSLEDIQNLTAKDLRAILRYHSVQEPMSRSMQVHYIPVTAFS